MSSVRYEIVVINAAMSAFSFWMARYARAPEPIKGGWVAIGVLNGLAVAGALAHHMKK